MSKFVAFKQKPTNHIYTPDAAENGTDEEKEAYSKIESEIAATVSSEAESKENTTKETVTNRE